MHAGNACFRPTPPACAEQTARRQPIGMTLTDFQTLGLAEPLLRALEAQGYTAPTPIQARAIPELRAGRDLVGIAQTGTGKTAAFVLPILDRFAAAPPKRRPKTAAALILVPTRELAAQVHDNLRTYAAHIRLRSTVVVGGTKYGGQIKALAGGVDVLIATPGRLEDLISSGHASLDHTSIAVLDEADQMMDLGFMPAMRRILAKVPADRQTVLLSATMPKQIRGLADQFLTDPAEVSVAPQSRPIERIAQTVREVPTADKRGVLADILADGAVERAVVFTRTKHGADKVARHLDKAGLPAVAIHGNKSQSQRTRALGAFKSGKTPILVATDIAARGIDIDGVSHVVNFDLPNVPEAYVHRIGRTGRAGKDGIAISLVDTSERGLLDDIERTIGNRLAIVDADGAVVRPAGPFAPAPKGARPQKSGKPGNRRRRPRKGQGGQAKGGQRPAA